MVLSKKNSLEKVCFIFLIYAIEILKFKKKGQYSH